jgi:gamma-glutamyl-gamma-aminobutyrate hydrolase PuuD
MKLIGITQRVTTESRYPERRDSLDQRWENISNELDCLFIKLPNNYMRAIEYLIQLNISAVILSGGNDLSGFGEVENSAPERDLTEYEILKYASIKKIPILGICRGMQMINRFFGGSLVPARGHSGESHIIHVSGHSHKESEVVVNSFHEWAITPETKGENLISTYVAADETIEGIVHEILPFSGIMWHPERNDIISANDTQIIKNALRLNK